MKTIFFGNIVNSLTSELGELEEDKIQHKNRVFLAILGGSKPGVYKVTIYYRSDKIIYKWDNKSKRNEKYINRGIRSFLQLI